PTPPTARAARTNSRGTARANTTTAHQPPGSDQGKRGKEAADDELAAQLQQWADTEGAIPSRDRICARFSIGSSRADRLRKRTTRPRALTVA
nr:hypothetical protein [Actinomycetota bacterium]